VKVDSAEENTHFKTLHASSKTNKMCANFSSTSTKDSIDDQRWQVNNTERRTSSDA
jgi:hypothetical protein